MAKKNKPGAGRPPKKNQTIIAKILELTAKGKTNQQMADIVGVAESTIRHWMSMDFEFSAAVKELKQDADELVEASLLKRSIGYDVIDTEDIKNEDDQIITLEKKRHIPADPTSIKFWLTNRQREKYTDKVDHSLSDPSGQPLTLVVKDYRTTIEKKEDK